MQYVQTLAPYNQFLLLILVLTVYTLIRSSCFDPLSVGGSSGTFHHQSCTAKGKRKLQKEHEQQR